jgi:hypothetical protein
MKFHTFTGIIPKLEPKNLPDTAAQVAENVNFGSKRLDPWKAPADVAAAPGTTSIFKWRRNSSYEWLGWNRDTDVVQSPVAEDQFERIYLTDGVKPKVVGWDGSKQIKYMEQPTATAPAAKAVSVPLSGSTATDLIALLKSATLTVTGTIYFSGQTANLGTTPTATNPTVSVSADKTEIYLDYPYSSWTFPGTIDSAAIYENNSVAGGYGSAMSISLPVSTFGTLTQSAGVVITDLGTLTFVGITGVRVNTYMSQENYNWPINIGSVGSGSRHIWNGSWANWSGTVSRVTLKMAYTDEALAAMAPAQSKSTLPDKFVYYVQTLINEWGMEGPPSSVSNEVGVMSGQAVTLSNFGSAQGATQRRFYRSVAGTTQDEFLEVATIDAGETTYTDELTDAELGDVIDLLENPPDRMKGIVSLPGGVCAAFKGREVMFSIPYKPWSWPSDYRETMDYDIIGLGVNGNDLYVLTDGLNYLITGYHPESRQVAKLAVHQSCVAKRSIAALGRMVVYASPDGLVGLYGGSSSLLTKEFYSREDWQAIGPSSMISSVHDDRYFGFCTNSAIVFDANEGAETCSTTDQRITGIYEDLEDDIMYLVQSGRITSWNQGGSNLTLTWRSKQFDSNRRRNWNCGRVVAEGYPLTVKLYADDSLAATIQVDSQSAFRIPKLQPSRVWSVEVVSDYSVDFMAIGTSMQEII